MRRKRSIARLIGVKKLIKNSAGFSLVEVMIGVTILLVAVGLPSLLGTMTRTHVKATRFDTCHDVAFGTLNRLRSLGYENQRALVVDDNIQISGISLDGISDSDLWAKSAGSSTLPTTGQVGANYYLNSHDSIVGSMAAIGAIYNRDINYCSNPTGLPYQPSSGASLLMNPNSTTTLESRLLNNVETRIRIQTYDLASGVRSCPPIPLYIRPVAKTVDNQLLIPTSEQLGVTVAPPNTVQHLGYEVTVAVSYNTPGMGQETCSVSGRFQYPRMGDDFDASGMVVSISQGAMASCASGRPTGRAIFTRNNNYQTDGLTYFCRDMSTPQMVGPLCPGGVPGDFFTTSNSWRPCEEVTLCGQPPTSSFSGAQIINDYSNIPHACLASIDMRALNPTGDTHANAVSGTYTFQQPPCLTCSTACVPHLYCSPATCSTCPPPPPTSGSGGGDGSADGGDSGPGSSDGADN